MNEALWALGRGTGIVALVMFTVALVLGITSGSGRPLPGLGRFAATDLHRTAALTGTALIAIHVGSLFFDPYAQLRLVDLVVAVPGRRQAAVAGPRHARARPAPGRRPASRLLRHRVGPRVFKAVHWATYAFWPIAFAHALGNGTDSASLVGARLPRPCAQWPSPAPSAGGSSPSYAGRGYAPCSPEGAPVTWLP